MDIHVRPPWNWVLIAIPCIGIAIAAALRQGEWQWTLLLIPIALIVYIVIGLFDRGSGDQV